MSAEDTTLTTMNAAGEPVVVHITVVTHHHCHGLCALQPYVYPFPPLSSNTHRQLPLIAKYWKDLYTFNPSRFLEDWPRDAFLPFGSGIRSCLGRRSVNLLYSLFLRLILPTASNMIVGFSFSMHSFAELESIVVITMILQKYKVIVREEPEFAGETFEQRKERVLKMKRGLPVQ